jgi:hypothetical protein
MKVLRNDVAVLLSSSFMACFNAASLSCGEPFKKKELAFALRLSLT